MRMNPDTRRARLLATIPALLAALLLTRAGAQAEILFDFDALPVHSGLPGAYTVGGITASFSATGQGFSVQRADVLGFTPAGFSGLCLYPSSVLAADLLISFSTSLTEFSILYAPEEYACDSSATMRVTAYLNSTLVGTATTNAQAGTWPTQTLRFSSSNAFDRVVVHYAARPATGGDWGPIFMVDNMAVTPVPLPVVLENAVALGAGGGFQFTFNNWPGGVFTVLAATNPAQPLATWTSLGSPTEISPGYYQFNDTSATSFPTRYYRVSSQ